MADSASASIEEVSCFDIRLVELTVVVQEPGNPSLKRPKIVRIKENLGIAKMPFHFECFVSHSYPTMIKSKQTIIWT